jgi:RNA polymerase sigma-70 factor (ECF subfamily)
MAGSTPVTLLERLRRDSDPASWQRLHDIYAPLLRAWLRQHTLQVSDVEDLVQEILAVVARRLPDFEHSGRKGAFRSWLRSIMANELRRYWRQRQTQPAAGGEEIARVLSQLEDSRSPLSRRWDQEHDRSVARRLLELIQNEFERTTWEAFSLLVLEEKTTAAVAAHLGLTANAVRIAKSRVMRRLRDEIGDLVDE